MLAEVRNEEWLYGARYMIYIEQRMSQAELARKTGARREHLNAVLRGRTDAGQKLQDRINQALGMTYDEIRQLGREHPTPLEALPADIRTPCNAYAEQERHGDIARYLCRLIVERLDGMDVEEQIAVLSRVKMALGDDAAPVLNRETFH